MTANETFGPVKPSISKGAFSCPRCGALADQSWFSVHAEPMEDAIRPAAVLESTRSNLLEVEKIAPHAHAEIKYLTDIINGKISLYKIETLTDFRVNNLYISKCFSCKEISVWLHQKLLDPVEKPQNIKADPDLPDDIARDFTEAVTIAHLSPRGAAALLRLCVQKICRHLGAPGDNINKDIAYLVKQGLDPRIQMSLDYVRIIGNNAVHPGHIDFKDDTEIVAALFSLVNLIVDRMITQPKNIDIYYNSLPQSAREQIEARDRRKSES